MYLALNTGSMFYQSPTSRLVYLPIHKNASTTFVRFFQRAGWVKVDKPKHNAIIFSHIQNPWQRYIKGVTELAWNMNERSFKNVRQMPFFKTAMLDLHLLPISIIANEYLDRIHFIPIDASIDSIVLTNQFFELHNCTLRVSNIDNLHIANLKKQAYKKEVEAWVAAKHLHRQHVKLLLKEDFKLYQSVLNELHSPAPVSWWASLLKRMRMPE